MSQRRRALGCGTFALPHDAAALPHLRSSRHCCAAAPRSAEAAPLLTTPQRRRSRLTPPRHLAPRRRPSRQRANTHPLRTTPLQSSAASPISEDACLAGVNLALSCRARLRLNKRPPQAGVVWVPMYP
uniref:Uncharacterized protein n=1 Tax=Leersia perrieri TaxID=77586 RepID=A0A0D9W9P7_9ORYZ